MRRSANEISFDVEHLNLELLNGSHPLNVLNEAQRLNGLNGSGVLTLNL
jgi:hypothetical protein